MPEARLFANTLPLGALSFLAEALKRRKQVKAKSVSASS
jgi:hypothetical protein